MRKHNLIILFFLQLLQLLASVTPQYPKPPPIPILPIPKARQLTWQIAEMSLFLHFGTNTYTNTEWGTGRADPSIFNPISLNATQWVQVAKDSGFKRVILTAKHHDGFCLWPSQYTDYSVKSSPWRDRSGDVVAELAKAVRISGLELGLYLSPWDRHERCYGETLEYNEYYMAQMTELLTRYGEVKYIFLDGAKGKGEKDMEYFFDDWFSLIHQLQPGASIFTDSGPDVRWVGNEDGFAGTTCWSLFNRSAVKIGADNDPKYVMEGDPFGHEWVPAECDVSIRPGWFWHPSEKPKSAMTLLDLYYKTVGRNCPLLLNVPPNTSGLISNEDVQVLKEFSDLRNSIFSRNMAKLALLSASSTRGGPGSSQFSPKNVISEGLYSYWAPDQGQGDPIIYLKFQQVMTFNVLELQEPIQLGQRIIEFHLDMLDEIGKWQRVVSGTTVGYRRLLLFPAVKSHLLRLVIDKSRGACPLISHLGIYMDSYSVSGDFSDTHTKSKFINNLVFRRTAYNRSQSAFM